MRLIRIRQVDNVAVSLTNPVTEKRRVVSMREKIMAGKAQADAGELIDGPSAMERMGRDISHM